MREALVEHAEDDVDRNQRRKDHQRLGADRALELPRIAGFFGVERVRQMQLRDGLPDCLGARLSVTSGARL